MVGGAKGDIKTLTSEYPIETIRTVSDGQATRSRAHVITVTGEYALRAAVHLAQRHPAPTTAAEIAGVTQVPPGYLSKIMQALVRAHLVTSQRGLGGGFQLSRDPGLITVLDVIVAAGSPIQRIHHCPLGLPSHTQLCPLHRLVDDAVRQIEEAFTASTLASLIPGPGGIEPLCDHLSEAPASRARKNTPPNKE